ncbi:acyl-CoA/acyl-ACP dehydrogenase [Candidatus Parvarchaeota archaeon]|nr:acyl-CoA/acyl-ACP dehydrogenase [Candidatus Parvarchaeota archaeon]
MEKSFSESIELVKNIYKFSSEELEILEKVDAAAGELVASEFDHYLKREVNTDALAIAKKHGILGLPIDKKYGGLGVNPMISVLAGERFGQVGLGFSTFFGANVMLAGMAVQNWGSDEQKERYLRRLAAGDIIMAFGLTEPDIGSDPMSLKTSYEKKGSNYILNGSKYYISNGGIANAVVVFARSKTNPAEISAFIVDTDKPGFKVEMELKEKIGLFTSDTGMLGFHDLEIPEQNILGSLGNGMLVAYSSILYGRLGISSACTGVMEDCLNSTVARAKERIQFGKEIGKHQLVQEHIAEIALNIERARWPTYITALRAIEYLKSPSEDLVRELDQRSAIAKRIASRAAWESADHAVQVFGGFGYSLLSPVGRHYCDTRVTRIFEGTDEIMNLKIASHILGKGFRAF